MRWGRQLRHTRRTLAAGLAFASVLIAAFERPLPPTPPTAPGASPPRSLPELARLDRDADEDELVAVEPSPPRRSID